MNQLWDALLNAAAGIAAAGIASALWLNIKWLIHSKRSMEKILAEIMSMRANATLLFQMQGPILLSLKASLEAQRDGKCNGNVDEALRRIEEDKKKFDEYLLSAIAGDETPKKAA